MKKDSLSFNEQVGIGTDLFNKFRVLFAFLLVFFITTFSAQEVGSEIAVKPDAVITVVGDAFIYSKDNSFNEQVSRNKNLQQNSKIEFTSNNELKISAKKNSGQQETVAPSRKKKENIVLATKKVDKYKSVKIPKRDINLFVKNLDGNSQFFAGSCSGNVSFISPVNDFHLSKYFVKPTDWFENISVKFSDNINYFYSNDSSTLQVFHNDHSVRPPPFVI